MLIYPYIIQVIDSTNLPDTNLSALSSTITWVMEKTPNATATFFGLIVGAFVTYFSQKTLKNREIKYIALNNANYVALLLCQERASLKKIEHFIDDRTSNKSRQKTLIFPTFLEIKQDSIEKILAYQEFFNHNYAHVLQSLIASEQAYRYCFKLIASYNEYLQKLLELRTHNTDQSPNSLETGYTTEINCCVKNIKKQYAEAVALNEQTKKHFDSLCKEVFNSLYKPLKIGDTIKATELFDN
jgi:hypothetical protein